MINGLPVNHTKPTPKSSTTDTLPTGITVSRKGRKFANYPPGLDANNTNDGTNNKYTVAELSENNTEHPYPNAEINNPPGGAINYSTFPASTYTPSVPMQLKKQRKNEINTQTQPAQTSPTTSSACNP
jgi:hypothetical protein